MMVPMSAPYFGAWYDYFFKRFRNGLCIHMTILYISCFFILLPLVCHDLKSSIYYFRKKPSLVQESMRQENTRRYEEAIRYLKMLNDTKLHQTLSHSIHNVTGVDVAITIITVSRNRHAVDNYEPKYLTQVVWKLLYLLHGAQASGFSLHVHLSICNVDGDTKSYSEAKELETLVHTFQRFANLYLPIETLVEKEKQDYVFCMNESLALNPRYVLLIEDDALPNDDFYTVLEHVIRTKLDNKFVGGSLEPNQNPGIYVKLYHPERLLSFINKEMDRIPQLISLGGLLGTVATLIYQRIFPAASKEINRTWIHFTIFFILFSVAIGRPNVIALKRYLSPHLYYYVEAPECCTPAMLFPRRGAVKVINHLSQVKCKWRFGKDTAIWRWQKENNYKAYMVQPNIVSHIGLYSGLRKVILDPFVV